MLYAAIGLLLGFLLGFLVRGFKKHKHKFKVICSNTSDKVDLTYRYVYANVNGVKKKTSDVHVFYEVCKCGEEHVIISDGSQDTFVFDEKAYIAYMQKYAETVEFKKSMGICN